MVIDTIRPKVFSTYVWGEPFPQAHPLTFASKSARADAIEKLSPGDLVFTVCTKTDPTPDNLKGRVVGLYEASDLEVNLADYEIELKPQDYEESGSLKFPYGLQPINVWRIIDQNNIFAELTNDLQSVDHLVARDKLAELGTENADVLLTLEKIEVDVPRPHTEFGKAKVHSHFGGLAPKHTGSFSGEFKNHEIWYVYVLSLTNQSKNCIAAKVGYSHDPSAREKAYNLPLATEVTGLNWKVFSKQPCSSEEVARSVEQATLSHFSDHILSSNIEIVSDVDPQEICVKIAEFMRSK